MPLQALALDLDGSLLEKNDALSAESVELLARARRSGVVAALFTGRMYCSALQFWEQIRPDTPIVAYNGAYIRHPGTGLLQHKPVALEDARALLSRCEAEGVHVNAYVNDQLCVPEDGGLGRWYADFYAVSLKAVGPLSQWMSEPSTKLLAIAQSGETFPTMKRVVESAVRGRNVRLTQSSDRYIEVLHPEVSKGTALRFLAEHLRIPIEQWAALGDAGNDIEMIHTAGLGIAIEGSPAAAHPHDATVPQGAAGLRVILRDYFGLDVSGSAARRARKK